MAWNLEELIDRVWFRIGVEQSSAEKRLYKHDLVNLVNDVLVEFGKAVANDSSLCHFLQTQFTVDVNGSTGASDILDNNATKTPSTPNWLLDKIYFVEYQDASGNVYSMHRLATIQDLFRPGKYGRYWWTMHDGAIEAIAADGSTRYSPGGSTLAGGKFRIHCNYIPTVATFVNTETLQPLLVRHLEMYARAKRDDSFAAQLMLREMGAM